MKKTRVDWFNKTMSELQSRYGKKAYKMYQQLRGMLEAQHISKRKVNYDLNIYSYVKGYRSVFDSLFEGVKGVQATRTYVAGRFTNFEVKYAIAMNEGLAEILENKSERVREIIKKNNYSPITAYEHGLISYNDLLKIIKDVKQESGRYEKGVD